MSVDKHFGRNVPSPLVELLIHFICLLTLCLPAGVEATSVLDSGPCFQVSESQRRLRRLYLSTHQSDSNAASVGNLEQEVNENARRLTWDSVF